MGKLDETIKNISYNQHEILYNIIQMHNGGKPFDCDPTYSIGNFYGDFKVKKSDGTEIPITIPQPTYKFDVCPQVEGVEKIEPLGPIPLETESVESVCVDLPFVISTPPRPESGPNSNIISRRFAYYYPKAAMFESYSHWLHEAYRILKPEGILVFKCQNTISGSQFLCTEEYSWFEATRIGFYTLDKFTIQAAARLISGKVKAQQHARNFTSTFWVFQKTGPKTKKITDYYGWMTDETSDKEILMRIMNAGQKPGFDGRKQTK